MLPTWTKTWCLRSVSASEMPSVHTDVHLTIPFDTCHMLMKMKQLQAPEDIEGGANRRCTDVLFMLALVMTWVAMTYLGADGIENGDPHLLVNGIDYNGRICGVDSGVKDKPKVWYC